MPESCCYPTFAKTISKMEPNNNISSEESGGSVQGVFVPVSLKDKFPHSIPLCADPRVRESEVKRVLLNSGGRVHGWQQSHMTCFCPHVLPRPLIETAVCVQVSGTLSNKKTAQGERGRGGEREGRRGYERVGERERWGAGERERGGERAGERGGERDRGRVRG